MTSPDTHLAERETPAGEAIALTRTQFIVAMVVEIARAGLLTPSMGLSLARRAYNAFEDSIGIQFGDPGHAWDEDAAKTIAREYEIDHWEAA